MLTLSLIIPVYNEERQIKACLEAVACQTVKPYEVLVVDNNCSDRTIEIASKFPFVKVITETKQGLIYARNAGFNAANGDILGRIDADAVIDKDWVEIAIKSFGEDNNLMGVTGLARTYLFLFAKKLLFKTVSRAYFFYAEADFGVNIMWGANMAVRKSAWEKVKTSATLDDHLVHEDQDLSCWFAAKGLEVKRLNSLSMVSHDGSLSYLPKFIEYDKRRIRTKKLHKKLGNISYTKRKVNNPIKVILGLTVGNIFRIYFWSGGMVLLLIQSARKK